ncbi:unnamed protein product [Spirodela intermedia]|uniref:Uncharacterized protein n=1 Tax=Spirodela intermedia TaxID=51605 RepID=A0A7I8IUT0_SPIIN|nr:unnamed protein product [Spirodela intermedia]CAA6661774.1 unnamed protein product [Spirodela intermedia]
MRKEETARNPKASWPKQVVRKWLNLKGGTEDFHSDCRCSSGRDGVQQRRKSCSDRDGVLLQRMVAPGGYLDHTPKFHVEPTAAADNVRVFVGTWNVGGRAPHGGLNLRDLLLSPSPVDIYVLGECVGGGGQGPAAMWLALIRQALNHPRRASFAASRSGSYGGAAAKLEKPRFSFSDLLSLEGMMTKTMAEEDEEDPSTSPNSGDERSSELLLPAGGAYRLVATAFEVVDVNNGESVTFRDKPKAEEKQTRKDDLAAQAKGTETPSPTWRTLPSTASPLSLSLRTKVSDLAPLTRSAAEADSPQHGQILPDPAAGGEQGDCYYLFQQRWLDDLRFTHKKNQISLSLSLSMWI